MNKFSPGIPVSEIDYLLDTGYAELSDDEFARLCENIIEDIKRYLEKAGINTGGL